MSIFSSILDKLGLNKKAAAPTTTTAAPAAQAAKPAAAATGKPPVGVGYTQASAAPAAAAKPAAISSVDVAKILDAKAAALPNKPNWRESIADLLFLLDLDHSLDARKELAQELGCPADQMGGDHTKMNIWLHKTVLKKIAENGGSVPKELL
jgi:hypothetical protein